MASSLRDNPLTPDLTAEQLRTRRGFAAAVAEGLARTGPSYPHGTEPWHPGEPDAHLAGFATKEDRDAYQCHAPGPFERVRRAPLPQTREDLRRYADDPEAAARYLREQAAALPRDSVDVEMLAVQHLRGLVPQWRDLDSKPPPHDDEDDREWAMFRLARDEIRRYLDSEPRLPSGPRSGPSSRRRGRLPSLRTRRTRPCALPLCGSLPSGWRVTRPSERKQPVDFS